MATAEEKGEVVAVLSQPDNISLFKEGSKVAPESFLEGKDVLFLPV